MINFRFHLVSVVAVFLALGVGVAMGASFIDRATVETMRGRLDQLETNYRERGEEIDSLRSRIEQQDRDVAALVEEDSALLAGRLTDTTVVMITAEGTSAEGPEAARAVLGTADATDGGGLVVDLDRLGADADALDEVRDLVGLSVAAPVRVRERALTSLGEALGVLAHGNAEEASAAPQPDDPTEPGVPDGAAEDGAVEDGAAEDGAADGGAVPGDDGVPTVEQRLAAEEFLLELVRIGVVRLEPPELTESALFDDAPVRFLMVVAPDGAGSDATAGAGAGGVPAEPGLRDLSRALATAAPQVLTVAEPATVGPVGDDWAQDRSTGLLVTELRDDETSVELLSSIDHLDEVIGRVALVLAIEEQLAGRVGHYGSGDGATAVVPRVPE